MTTPQNTAGTWTRRQEDYMWEVAQEVGLRPALLRAVLRSGHDPFAPSAQQPFAWLKNFDLSLGYDPMGYARRGHYLRTLLDRNHGDETQALIAYHGFPNADAKR